MEVPLCLPYNTGLLLKDSVSLDIELAPDSLNTSSISILYRIFKYS